MEWFIAEQAIFCVSGATVPFYDTLGPESVQFILKQTDTKTVVCTRGELERLCKVKRSGECPNFEYAILADGVIPEAATMAREAGLQVMSFAKVEAVGAQRIATTAPVTAPCAATRASSPTAQAAAMTRPIMGTAYAMPALTVRRRSSTTAIVCPVVSEGCLTAMTSV